MSATVISRKELSQRIRTALKPSIDQLELKGIQPGLTVILVGEVQFDVVSKKVGFVTPVPGGVGPMTHALPVYNTVKSACQYAGLPFGA